MQRFAWSVVVLLAAASDLSAAFPTTATLSCGPNPAAVGQAVDCGANVSGPPGTSVPSGGQVTFYDGALVLYSMSLLEGGAAFTTSSLAPGTHPITAVYDGNASFAGSTSNTFNELVAQAEPAPTSTTLGSTKNPSLPGDTVVFTMTVTSSAGRPNGLAILMDGDAVINQMPLMNGMVAVMVTFTAAGSHPMTATYAGSASFAASSATLTQVIDRFTTRVVVTSSMNPAATGQPVTFTASVLSEGDDVPTGTIEWSDGAMAVATTTLDASGSATLVRTLTAGLHVLTAFYSSDALHSDGSGDIVEQVLVPRRRAVGHL